MECSGNNNREEFTPLVRVDINPQVVCFLLSNLCPMPPPGDWNRTGFEDGAVLDKVNVFINVDILR